jgi:molybdate transport system substrate-binding protein
LSEAVVLFVRDPKLREADLPNGDIKIMSSGGLKGVFGELAEAFERASGRRLETVFNPPNAVKTRVENGESFDVVVLSAVLIDELAAKQRVVPASRVALARSGLGVAVRKGAPKPDIGTTEAFRAALLNAKSIVCSDPAGGAASGIHFQKVIERLGIAKEVMAKARLNSGSYNAEIVARGEAEIAIQQISEIVPVKGADLVGPLPPEVQVTTVFVAAIGANSTEPTGAQALIDFLTSAAARRVITTNGMEAG